MPTLRTLLRTRLGRRTTLQVLLSGAVNLGVAVWTRCHGCSVVWRPLHSIVPPTLV
ncbi:hypothetical protein HCTV5_116 [Halovirus HCTV-5]|uniref:hypothetical protein n=1 Tax=Halovirus HCTV-5 TaxID=1273748 RepID=UPI0003348D55|nr:hypothetical protein M200_gp064 [Halovirus HCTV-5]AGM11770.1 hypothetical protein HCTV5_116 [Halovirus HCTV-5]